MQSENKDLLVLLLITGGIAIFGFAIFFFLQGVFMLHADPFLSLDLACWLWTSFRLLGEDKK